jgi:hypothetical protein
LSFIGFRDVVTERAPCLQPLDFTERQARFLATVMVHSGVFLDRQYCRFAGITHGQKSHDFIARLLDRQYARVESTWSLCSGRNTAHEVGPAAETGLRPRRGALPQLRRRIEDYRPIEEPPVIIKILSHLRLPTRAPLSNPM